MRASTEASLSSIVDRAAMLVLLDGPNLSRTTMPSSTHANQHKPARSSKLSGVSSRDILLATKELRMSRRSLRTVAVAITVATVVLVSHLTAQTPAVALADYQRAVALQARFTGKATGVPGGATWLTSGKFWYRKS